MLRRRPALWVAGIGALLGLPAMLFGFPFPTHDGRFHAAAATGFAEQLWAGDWYPRWLQNVDGGLGGPIFSFYPPIPFYAAALFEPWFPGPQHAWRILGFGAALALMLSGVFMYRWLVSITGERPAAVAAVLYMAAPYHFAIDLHVRGAYAELWSFVWMPLVLLCVQRIADGSAAAIGLLAISYAMLVMTHAFMAVMFSAIPIAHAWWMSSRERRWRALLQVATGMLLGAGLAGVYLVPAFLDRSFASDIHGTAYQVGYNVAFVRDTSGRFALANTSFAAAMFWVMAATLPVAASAWLTVRQSSDATVRRHADFWAAVAVLAALMTTSIGAPIYRLVPPLQLIQFPWRFNAIIVLATAAMAGHAFSAGQSWRTLWAMSAIRLGALMLLVWVVVTVGPVVATSVGARSARVPTAWQVRDANTLEYRPRWATHDARSILRRLASTGTATAPATAKARMANGAVRIVDWRPRHLRLAVDSPSGGDLEIAQYYYPGWHAVVDGRPQPLVPPTSSDGLIEMAVPAGRHVIDLRFEASLAERRGLILSATCLAVLVASCLLLATHRRRFSP